MTLLRNVAVVGFLAAFGCAGGPGSRDALNAGDAARSDGGAAAQAVGGAFVYVGMTGGEIALFHLDAATGILGRRGGASAGRAPSSLVRSAERGTLVAIDGATGQATSFSIDEKSGAPRPVGRASTSAGAAFGATLDDSGRYVLAAHPASGRVSVLAITQAGALKAIDTFAAGGGARAVAVHPAQVAFVSNFRAGSVSQYAFNMGTGMLTARPGAVLELPAGSGPARIVCHPNGRWAFLLDQKLDSIAVFSYDQDLKALSPISSQVVSTRAEGSVRGRSRPADLAISPSGRFLYVTSRGPNDVAAFAIDAGGTLSLVGRVPGAGGAFGALAVDPSGRILIVANEGGKSLSVYPVDPTTGALGGARIVALAAAPLSVLAVRP